MALWDPCTTQDTEADFSGKRMDLGIRQTEVLIPALALRLCDPDHII